MPAQQAKKHPLSVVSSPGDNSDAARRGSGEFAQEPCPFCFGTGMEVFVGRGARRCRCRAEELRAKLLEAARIPSATSAARWPTIRSRRAMVHSSGPEGFIGCREIKGLQLRYRGDA